jgi:hypothetical protein
VYSWMWRHLPGPLAVRLVITTIAITAIVAVLFIWVFPSIADRLPINDGAVRN